MDAVIHAEAYEEVVSYMGSSGGSRSADVVASAAEDVVAGGQRGSAHLEVGAVTGTHGIVGDAGREDAV